MKALIAEEFLNHPEVQKAQETLVKLLEEHKSKITGIVPSDSERKASYGETLKRFAKARGGGLFFPYVSSGMGNGPYVELEDGSVKLDFITGIGVHFYGHSHSAIAAAALKAALGDTTMQGNLQQTGQTLRVCEKFLELANKNGAKFDHCFLSSIGVMAGENALKIAFQFNHPRNRVLAFKKCFAGRTLAFSQITDKHIYRHGLPMNMPVDYVPFLDSEDLEGSTKRAADTLHEYFMRYPDQHAAMIFEFIQGEGGYYGGSEHFHKTLMEICREHGVLVLADEVQTFSRTTEPYAFQFYKLDKLVDLVWVGKASQVCATIFKEAQKPKPGLISQTFTSSSTAIAAAEIILEDFKSGDFFGENGRNAKLGKYFTERLTAMSEKHPDLMKGPYGEGLMIGFTAYEGDGKKSLALIYRLFESGLMAFTAGSAPTRIRFLIPGAVTETKHIDEACEIIEKELTK